jgi:class 3 adenylate cyclase
MEKFHVPPDLELKLKKEGAELKKTGELKKITVLSVDMRGFSPIVQKYNEETVLSIIDLYFRILSSIVRKYDGVVYSVVGNGLMAVWGLPVHKKFETYKAVRAAIEMRIGMFHFIPELVRIGAIPIEIGIGIGTGTALTGFIGPPSMKDFILVGNCIERAMDLQSVASNNRIFIDRLTAAEVSPFSFLIPVNVSAELKALEEEKIYEVEGIYEVNEEYEPLRRHPRVIVAKVVGITKPATKQRKPGLIKSIGEGGLGFEIHDYKDFDIQIGEETVFDSKGLSLFGMKEVKGFVVRKIELEGSGVFHLKTWEIGVKLVQVPEETKKLLLKIHAGSKIVREE